MMAAMRSSPMPVSMFFFGNGSRVPSSWPSYWVNTQFQYSRNRSQSQPGAQSGLPQPNSGPWS